MRFNILFSALRSFKIRLKPCTIYRHYKINTGKANYRLISTGAPVNLKVTHYEAETEEDLDHEDSYLNFKLQEGYARDLLYKNSRNILLQRIYCCASVQELLNVVEKNLSYYGCDHITQTVFVLYDLQEIYRKFSSENNLNEEMFFENLQKDKRFGKLLEVIENKASHFDVPTLSYCTLYLNKLGVSVETTTMQVLCNRLKKELTKKFSLEEASRFLETVFSEHNLRSYFMSQDLVPLVLKEIDLCQSAQTLEHLSVSLNKLHNIVTKEDLDKYKRKIENFLADGSLKPSDYKVLLKIVAFLNYPQWRYENSVLISKCILLMKDNLNKLNINEILFVYEIFFKIEEPAHILNDLQRCTYKFFNQMEDIPTEQKIALLYILIFFTSSHQRTEFHKKIKNYVAECDNYESLILLRKLLSYIKTSDLKLCNSYWSKILNLMNESTDLVKLSQHYINFNSNINYRHKSFETELLKLLFDLVKNNCNLFPHRLAHILNFVLLYSEDKLFLELLVSKLEENWGQLKPIDCLNLSFTLKLFDEIDRKYVKSTYARRIDKTLEKFINKGVGTDDLWTHHVLLKSCVYKNKMNESVMNQLFKIYKDFNNITSKNLENIYYSFLMTNSLVPEILDNATEYILTYKNHVLGFNAGRIMYLCYHLGYHPKKLTEFSEATVDILIRDQERMTGLSIIYTALALCFFNKLPKSLLKTIFNVEFMDKLDAELERCYAKDKYPNRVRNYLMQLNRAVCLDYPESSVPWFHQKYVEECVKGRKQKSNLFAVKVKEHLIRLVQNNAVSENVVTPYGYEIDFLINLNTKEEVPESQSIKKLALLLIPEYAYTRIVSQLKGSFQLKKRHLEMLGYRVVLIKSSDWIQLFYAEERMEYLRNLIFSETNIPDR